MHMIKSFNTWDSLNESLLHDTIPVVQQRGIGNDKKVKYKIDSKTSFKYATINMDSMVDSNGKLTSAAIKSMASILNGQAGWTKIMGHLDGNFFKKNILIYKVKKDSKKTSKIQFTVMDRTHPDLAKVDTSIQFMSTDELAAISANSNALRDVINKTNAGAEEEMKVGQEGYDADKKAAKVGGDSEYHKHTGSTVKDAIGKKFRYLMRSNGKTYSMEFTEDETLKANLNSGETPEGTIFVNTDNKVVWTTDKDSVDNGKDPLSGEGSLVLSNDVDTAYLTKMFLNSKFREKELSTQVGDSSNLTADSLKAVVYHMDDTLIFADEVHGDVDTNDTNDTKSSSELEKARAMGISSKYYH